MDAGRYYVAAIVLVAMPSALAYWLLIHPLADRWRRLGPWPTGMIIGIAVAAVALAIFRFRSTLLGVDLGYSPLLSGLAMVLVVGAGAIGFTVRKQMTVSTLIGRPELNSKRHPGRLVTVGIYGRIRHPRYVEGTLGMLGCTLFSNYFGLYVVFMICLPVLYFVVILEDRELAKRFGPAFVEYSRIVPRFFPKVRLTAFN